MTMYHAPHPDVEFQVSHGNESRYYPTWNEACGTATDVAFSRGVSVHIDVLIWSPEGAKAWGGEDAVERYEEDPEASVFERFVLRADSQGMIP